MYLWLKRTLILSLLATTLLISAKGQTQTQTIVFGRGGDGALWHNILEGSSATGWRSLGGQIGSAPDACSWGPGRVDVFAKGQDNRLWQIARIGSDWTGWVQLDGNLASAPSAVSWGPNRIDVFALGADNTLIHKAWNGTAWTGWESLGGVFSAGARPAAASRGPNQLDVFMRGTDNALWQNAWNGSKWSGWNRVGGTLNSDPGAVSWGGNRVDVFALATDNSMQQIAWDGARWTQWYPQGGVFDANSNPNATSTGANRLEVVARGRDKAYWLKRWDGTQWVEWQSLGGLFTSDASIVSVRYGSPAAQARFRVTINGFIVDRQTADDSLERDGRGDEVFFLAQARLTEGERSLRDSGLLRSRVMGDANGRSDRVNAGSSPPNLIAPTTGGLRTGDTFPSSTPWRPATAPTADRAPMLLFDGDLASGQTLTIVPTIWEWDGPDDLLTVAGRTYNLALGVGAHSVMPAPMPTGLLGQILGVAEKGIGSEVRVGLGIFGDPHDRPIGMQFSADVYTFRPQRLLMSYELADAASRADFGFGAGVIPIRYTDDRELQGDYRIFVQIQRLM